MVGVAGRQVAACSVSPVPSVLRLPSGAQCTSSWSSFLLLFHQVHFLIIFAANRDVKANNSSCSFFSKFRKIHFTVAVLSKHLSVKRGG